MFNAKDIKLIIWDLDDAFWHGTISEGDITIIESNVSLIKDSTDIGIVNSICSKNEYLSVKEKLTELSIWDYFVFASIDWSAKGERIKKIIDIMKLRPANVLFIDDNIQNLEEAKHFCPGIMTTLPNEIDELYLFVTQSERTDKGHTRLAQYRLLEQKEAFRTESTSNEDFLKSCNICVEIKYDCDMQIDRLHELVMRSNQLNFTKNRQSKEELKQIIDNRNICCGYVSVSDRFGDYGIVGFFAIENNKAIHFVFSCRTLGMQIEQYVFQEIGCPEIEIVGEVVAELKKDFSPNWINQKSVVFEEKVSVTQNKRILLKGPCDMSQMYAFLSNCDNLLTEFSYINDEGILIEGHNHTSQFVTALRASKQEKESMMRDMIFYDDKMLYTNLLENKIDILVLSMLTDGNLGIYRHKKTGYEVAFFEKFYDLTDPKNTEKYISGKATTLGAKITKDKIEEFSKNYEYVDNSTWDKTVENLQYIWEYISKETTMVLLLGTERPFEKKVQQESYLNRHQEHILLNNKIREWSKDKDNVKLLPFDAYLKSNSDFIDTINHFVKRVYYDLAKDLINIFNENNSSKVEVKGKTYLFLSTIIQKLRYLKKKLLKK